MKKQCAIIAIVLCLAFAACAAAGEKYASLFAAVDAAPFGAVRSKVRSQVGTILQEEEHILVTADTLDGVVATRSYLFNGEGRLYNISWCLMTPVRDIDAARTLNNDLLTAMRSRYKKPSFSEKDGNPSKAKDVGKVAAEKEKVKERIAALKREKGEDYKPTRDEMKKILEDIHPLDMLPTLFYSEQHYWNTRKMYIYVALFCSTGGDRIQHINFISKQHTAGEKYPTGKRAPFSYTPLDRDQDMITRNNRALPEGFFSR